MVLGWLAVVWLLLVLFWCLRYCCGCVWVWLFRLVLTLLVLVCCAAAVMFANLVNWCLFCCWVFVFVVFMIIVYCGSYFGSGLPGELLVGLLLWAGWVVVWVCVFYCYILVDFDLLNTFGMLVWVWFDCAGWVCVWCLDGVCCFITADVARCTLVCLRVLVLVTLGGFLT